MEELFFYVFFVSFCVIVVWSVIMMALTVKWFIDKLRWDREIRKLEWDLHELEWKRSHGG